MTQQLTLSVRWQKMALAKPQPPTSHTHLKLKHTDATFAQEMMASDLHTWHAVRAGDKLALRSVFEEHYAALCRFAMQWTSDADDAEEIVQKMFVELWEKRSELKIEITLRSYLYASVRNRCLNFLKHQKVEAVHAQYVRRTSSEQENISEIDEVNAALQQALLKLPEQCARVFHLVKMEGKRYAEVAEELGISVKTIENHMTKALRILRSELSEYLPICLWLLYFLNHEIVN